MIISTTNVHITCKSFIFGDSDRSCVVRIECISHIIIWAYLGYWEIWICLILGCEKQLAFNVSIAKTFLTNQRVDRLKTIHI